MKRIAIAVMTMIACPAPAQDQYGAIAERANQRLVKVFGTGGYRGIAAYGTGTVVSADGYAVTAAGSLLDTSELRIHLWDGRRCLAKVIVIEPALDLALIKIDGVDDLPYFDLPAAADAPRAQPGDWVLALSNQFEIATRGEPMSVQRGVIAAYARLPLQRTVGEVVYSGEVFVLDAITNNPGAAGGALVSRTGDLLGIVGKELRNPLTDTWINYSIPVQAKVDVHEGETTRTVSLDDMVSKGIKGEYKPSAKPDKMTGLEGGYHGMVLVPNVVERTPPYVEEVIAGTPAAKAGVRPDDLIVYLDGDPVTSISDFRAMMSRTHAGQSIKLEVRRGDKLESLELKLEERPKR